MPAPSVSVPTANNTSGCFAASNPSYCKAAFPGMTDSNNGGFTINAVPDNTSTVPTSALLYPGNNTLLFAHYLPWFCVNSLQFCNGHVQTGYNSNDANTVAGQINDMKSRGLSGMIIDWYGSGHAIENGATLLIKKNLDLGCVSAQSCPFYFALMEDQGAFDRGNLCPFDPTKLNPAPNPPWDQATRDANCLKALENDISYMSSTYFGSNSYLKAAHINGRWQISSSGRPLLFFFINEAGFVNPTPTWATIFTDAKTFGATRGNPLFIFRNALWSHPATDGQYGWIERYLNYTHCPSGMQSLDPFGLCQLDQFYDSSITATLQQPALLPIGTAFKGFDCIDSSFPCDTTKFKDQQCGLTWLQNFKQTGNIFNGSADYSSAHQLPFLQIATWNDYDEGHEIETGIDNCVSQFPAATIDSGQNLNWALTFGSTTSTYANGLGGTFFGDPSTIHHYELWDTNGGATYADLGGIPPSACSFAAATHTATCSVSLQNQNLFLWQKGTHTLFVQAVGQPSIHNHVTASSVTYVTKPTSMPLPSALGFQEQVVGVASGWQMITLNNTGNAVLNISSISISGDFHISSTSCGTTLVPGAACNVFVYSLPTSSSTGRSGFVTFNDNADNSPQQVLLTSWGMTQTALSSSLDPSVAGNSVKFTAQLISPDIPMGWPAITGSVAFYDGATRIGTGMLNSSGIATFSTSSLTAGLHRLVAVYGGDDVYSGSNSAVVLQLVNAPGLTATSATVSKVASPAFARVPAGVVERGQTLKMTVSMNPLSGPTGNVQFVEGLKTWGTAVLKSGVATFTTNQLTLGQHAITAVYLGDATHAGTFATPMPVVILRSPKPR